MPRRPASPMRRLARVSYGATGGLALGTVAGVATGSALAPGLGAPAGALLAVIGGRLWERRA